MALEHPTAHPRVFPQMCVNPRNRNVSGLQDPARGPLLSGEPADPDQARLLGMELQAELREPLAKVRPEPLGISSILETHHKVVSETRDDNVTARGAEFSTGEPTGQRRSAE